MYTFPPNEIKRDDKNRFLLENSEIYGRTRLIRMPEKNNPCGLDLRSRPYGLDAIQVMHYGAPARTNSYPR
jgi:hypothetical protein